MNRKEVQSFLDIKIFQEKVEYKILETVTKRKHNRQLIEYAGSENDPIRAFLFTPTNCTIIGGVLIHHQHNGERHLGKSEVAGLAGDPMQFFCPSLADRGFVCLAPDSICFEDRRTNKQGIDEDEDPDDDILQHYNEMCYRILKGSTLMKKVIEDSSIAISILSQMENIPFEKIGLLGHSYGGNTVIFHSPLDDRIKFSCSSGAVCTYKTKVEHDIGIELAEVIPGIMHQFDIQDIVLLNAPREFLIVSSDKDIYSKDAPEIYEEINERYNKEGATLTLAHYAGPHALDEERFNFIIQWFEDKFLAD